MIKKVSLLFILFLMLLTVQCTVNETTGLVSIYNLTDYTIHNIHIGDTLILFSLGPGEKYDYWYLAPLQGKIHGDEVDVVLVKYLVEDKDNDNAYVINKDDADSLFKVNYEYHWDIVEADKKVRLYVHEGRQPSDNTDYDYPAR